MSCMPCMVQKIIHNTRHVRHTRRHFAFSSMSCMPCMVQKKSFTIQGIETNFIFPADRADGEPQISAEIRSALSVCIQSAYQRDPFFVISVDRADGEPQICADNVFGIQREAVSLQVPFIWRLCFSLQCLVCLVWFQKIIHHSR